MRLRHLIPCIPLLLTVPPGCTPPPSEGGTGETGMALTVDLDGNTDLAGIRFSFTRVSCMGESITPFQTSVDKELADFHISGADPVPGNVLHPSSKHLFSDAFQALEAGCYDVKSTPLAAGGVPSKDCYGSTASGVKVTDGQTTEVTLYNQCSSKDKTGAIDALGIINHAPSIKGFTFQPDKFVNLCPGGLATHTMCATALDPDNDPLLFQWVQTSGPAPLSGPTIVSSTPNPPSAQGTPVTQCVQIIEATKGQSTWSVTVYDEVQPPGSATLITFDQWYAQNNVPWTSHDDLSFPSYVLSDPSKCTAQCNQNGACEVNETYASCPQDCKQMTCGNNTCDAGETVTNCPHDCQSPCGNGVCGATETYVTCPQDCKQSTCGNNTCDAAETSASCPHDCTQTTCGNNTCDAGETNASCPHDCQQTTCGNNTCDAGETTASCPHDCQPQCSNGVCGATETYVTCPQDCTQPTCGNNTCDAAETSTSCPHDCTQPTCGNNTCDAAETYLSCPHDCQQSTCGNNTCDGSETTTNCPHDCTCGNGTCDPGETSASCGVDCPPPPVCDHDGVCEAGETYANCPSDCPVTYPNGVCDPGETAANNPQDCKCGDGTCDPSESAASCASDCSILCMPGKQVGCYTGPSGTNNVGACHGGQKTCNSNGVGYGYCIGQVTPKLEVCNLPGEPSVDEDCNNSVNEGVCTYTAIASGMDFSVALRSDGTVWTWGENAYGQLGDGTMNPRNVPAKVPNLDNIVSIAAGAKHVLALATDGTVWGWGYNTWGQTGDPATNGGNTTAPAQVYNLSDVAFVSAGAMHSLAVLKDGTAWGWGYNGYGETGATTYSSTYAPSQIAGLSDVASLAGGGYHSIAMLTDGSVFTFGDNSWNELGVPGISYTYTPQYVLFANASAVAAGGDIYFGGGSYAPFTLALKAGGVWGFGYNGYGQLGTSASTTKPTAIPGLSGVTGISAGMAHTLALLSNGTVKALGLNASGQLGNNSGSNSSTPVDVIGLSGIQAVSAGHNHSMALYSGTVGGGSHIWTWGDNTHGELGDGTNFPSAVPVPISLP